MVGAQDDTEDDFFRHLLRYGLRSRAQAAGADLEADRYALKAERLVLDVGLERAVSAGRLALPPSGVLVPDIAAVGRRLAANVASRHESYLYPQIVRRWNCAAWYRIILMSVRARRTYAGSRGCQTPL